MRYALALLALASCRTEGSVESQRHPLVAEAPAPPSDTRDDRTASGKPPSRIAPIKSALCVTTGAASIGAKIETPAMRAVAKGTDGEAAALMFTFRGETPTTKRLASGASRRQLGLKLRAENGCNLIYVMWRLDPKPMVYAQLKRNPGAKDHKACGADGYKKIKPLEDKPPPATRTRCAPRSSTTHDSRSSSTTRCSGAAPCPTPPATCAAPPAFAPTTSRSISSASRPRRPTSPPATRSALPKTTTDHITRS